MALTPERCSPKRMQPAPVENTMHHDDNDILHFHLETAMVGAFAIYMSDRNGDLTLPQYLFADFPEEVFLVMDEYGYQFEFEDEDSEEHDGEIVGTHRYTVWGEEITLDAPMRLDLPPKFGARIDTEVGGEGYRTCDECDRATLAGEGPDWPNGKCEDCDPALHEREA